MRVCVRECVCQSVCVSECVRVCVLYLQCGAHPEGVAGVDGFVGSALEAVPLPQDAPAADPVQLPLAQSLLQPAHEPQRRHRTECGPAWGSEVRGQQAERGG